MSTASGWALVSGKWVAALMTSPRGSVTAGGPPSLAGSTKAVAGLGSGGTDNSCTRGRDVYTAISAELPFIDSVLPQATTPPTDPTTPTDPTNPDAPGDPVDPDDDDTDHPPQIHGCSTGGSTGGLVAIGLALLALRRRR